MREENELTANCQQSHSGPCWGELWVCTECGVTNCSANGAADDAPEVCDDCYLHTVITGFDNRSSYEYYIEVVGCERKE